MKRGASIGLGLAGALLLIGVAFAVFVAGPMMAGVIEELGSEATDTAVRVGDVEFDWTALRATLRDVTIANPPGFSKEPALELDAITIDLEGGSLLSEPIVLSRLRVLRPVANVVVRDVTETNLAALRDNLRASVEAGRPGPPPAEPGDVVAEKASRTRVRIERFAIGAGDAHVVAPDLGIDDPLDVSLAPATERSLGGADGAKPGELTRQVALAIVESTAKSVADSAVTETLGHGGIADAVRDALHGVVEAGRDLIEKLGR